jgi:hypothetical protein
MRDNVYTCKTCSCVKIRELENVCMFDIALYRFIYSSTKKEGIFICIFGFIFGKKNNFVYYHFLFLFVTFGS